MADTDNAYPGMICDMQDNSDMKNDAITMVALSNSF